MRLTHGRFPGLVTALYLTLTLSSLVYTAQSQGREAGWELCLMMLTFPLSFVFVFLDYLWRDPWDGGYGPVFLTWLFLVFTTVNAYAIHRACRHIFRED